ncbi:MAG: tRNA-modifying protein YgfZ [Holosporales bacterium]
MLCALDYRSVLKLSGNDRYSFIQGFLTQDIFKIKDHPLLYSWILSPKGRYQFDVFIFEKDHVLYIDTDQPEELLKKLTLHKLRSAIDIQKTSLSVYAGDGVSDFFFSAPDPRSEKMPMRIYTDQAFMPRDSLKMYDDLRASIPLPEGIKDLTLDKSLPLEWQMDLFHAVSFTKGCYIGQELTTRTKHLKMIKKYVAVTQDASTIPADAIIKTYGSSIWYWKDVLPFFIHL